MTPSSALHFNTQPNEMTLTSKTKQPPTLLTQFFKERRKIQRKKHYFLSKSDDPKMYEQLQTALQPYFTAESLTDINHSYITQNNESLNGVIATLAPKHKNYSSSTSLKGRVSLAILITNIGYHSTLVRLYTHLSINMSRAIFEWSLCLDERSERKRKRSMNPINKIIRNKKKIKLQVDEAKSLSIDKKKKMSYKGKGRGNPQGKKLVENTSSVDVRCASCGEQGHRRASHRLCRNNKKNALSAAMQSDDSHMLCKPTGEICVEDACQSKNIVSTVGLTVCDSEYDENMLGGHTDKPLVLTSNSASSSNDSELEDFLYFYADDNS